jgi:Fe2+ transport system protein FeoA/Mn-dependent DtxR family transcriptional regulator
VQTEDALKAAFALQNEGIHCDAAGLSRLLGISTAASEDTIRALVASGWAKQGQSGRICLTETGKARAVELVRAHRLWERYLADREGRPLDIIHGEAHLREHETTPEQIEELDAELGYPTWDPHGQAIPDSGSRVPPSAGRSLLETAVPGSRFRIVRLDETSGALLAQIVALGLEPGIEIGVLALASDLLQVQVNERVVPLPCSVAGHVFVVPAPAQSARLGELAVGDRAQVLELMGSGKLQRRMLTMGFVPGAEVAVIRQAPLGDPRQYRVKKANIALRRDEANMVLVKKVRKE